MATMGESRPVYRPSGNADWLRFLPGLAAVGGSAVVMAWCLYWVYCQGFYLIFVAPLIAALVVGGVWYLVLTGAHCRNTALATVGSIVLAAVLYLGHYHAGLVDLIGVRNAHRIDLLPWYVQFRMRTDVARDAHHVDVKPAVHRGPDAVQRVFNWVFFSTELVAVVGILAGIGRHCASRAYCEACGRWMKSETLKLPPGLAAASWSALQQGDLAAVRQSLASTSRHTSISAAVVTEHCPTCPAEHRPSAVYLTVKDVPVAGMPDPIAAKIGAAFKPRHTQGLRTIAGHVELYPEEVGALAGSFPGLKETIGAYPSLFADAQSAAREIELHDKAPVAWPADRLATVVPVEPQDAGVVLTRTNAILQTVIGVGSTLGGLALALVPAGVLCSIQPPPPDWVAGVTLVWMFGGMLLNLVWCLFFARYPTSLFMLRKARRAFEQRPNPAVDLNDPDLVFVDIIPRVNWGKAMMENATDIGFLEFDDARRQLVFEGDRERYWIPAESILGVAHEFWAESVQHELQRAPSLNHVIVVRAMTADGPWETWFYQRHNHFRMQTAKRRLSDALELEARLRGLMQCAT